jgi:hypothetical protein
VQAIFENKNKRFPKGTFTGAEAFGRNIKMKGNPLTRDPFEIILHPRSYHMIVHTTQKGTEYLKLNPKWYIKGLVENVTDSLTIKCFEEDLRERYRV